MAKMKKALGSLALIIALAMIIGMLPTIVLASNTTAITTQADACYDEEEGIVTVEGTISSSEADVTILAVRSAEEITSATSYFEEIGDDIGGKIVYIDQVGAEDVDNYEATEDGANWNFTFVPKEGVPGGWITVFVGGTDASIDLVSFSAQIPAPTLAAQTWYMGEDLVMDITYADAEAIAAWESAIDSVLVNGSAFEDYVIDEDEATITFTGLSEAVTSIEITTVDGEYAAIEMTGLNIAAQPKAAGTVAPASATVVENDTASVAFDVTESAQGGWLAEFGAEGSAVVKVDTVETDDWSYVAGDEGEGVLTISGLTVGADDEKMFSVVVEATNYAASTAATVTVISPTKADVDSLPAYLRVVYGEDGNTDDDAEGAATITLPCADSTIATNGSTITWTTTPTLGEGVVSIEGDVLTVVRPIEGATDPQEVTVIARVAKGDYATKTKTYTLSVNQIGVAGPTFTVENVALTTPVGGAFGVAGNVVVTVTNAEVDPALSKVMVGEVELFYSPERMKFVGIIPEATADDVVANITVESAPSTNLYYGKVAVPAFDGTLNNGDISRAVEIAKGNLAGMSDAQLLASDVTGAGKCLNGSVSRIVEVAKGNATKDTFTIIERTEE